MCTSGSIPHQVAHDIIPPMVIGQEVVWDTNCVAPCSFLSGTGGVQLNQQSTSTNRCGCQLNAAGAKTAPRPGDDGDNDESHGVEVLVDHHTWRIILVNVLIQGVVGTSVVADIVATRTRTAMTGAVLTMVDSVGHDKVGR